VGTTSNSSAVGMGGWMKKEQVWISVTTSNNRTIRGNFVSRPHMGVAFLTSSQVVGTTSNSSAVGMGGVYGYYPALFSALPADLAKQDLVITSSIGFYGRIIQNVTNSTAASLNGPATTTQNGGFLLNFTAVGASWFFNLTTTQAVPINPFFVDAGTTYLTVASTKFPGGEIRGQVLPIMGSRHRKIPSSVVNIFGTTSGTLSTLRRASQTKSFANHKASYVICAPDPSTNLFQAIFNYRSNLNKRNVDGIKGYTFEMNLRGQNQLYTFEFYNSLTASWTTIGTFNGTISWTPLFAAYYGWDSANYVNSHGYMQVRVSSSGGVGKLLVDLMSVRVFHARFLSSQTLRAYTKFLQHLPAQ